jgi:hypothetical protein
VSRKAVKRGIERNREEDRDRRKHGSIPCLYEYNVRRHLNKKCAPGDHCIPDQSTIRPHIQKGERRTRLDLAEVSGRRVARPGLFYVWGPGRLTISGKGCLYPDR